MSEPKLPGEIVRLIDDIARARPDVSRDAWELFALMCYQSGRCDGVREAKGLVAESFADLQAVAAIQKAATG